jgi:hypothetical protein
MDEFVIEGGRPSATRHDPAGHEDCAADWDPCKCHGDRLCNLGKYMGWYRNSLWYANENRLAFEAADAAYLVEREVARLNGLLTPIETVQRRSDAQMKVYLDQRQLREWPREIWPLIVANARLERESLASSSRA